MQQLTSWTLALQRASSNYLEATFKLSGTLDDPDVVTCVVTAPDGTSVNYAYPASISRVSLGLFRAVYTPASAGT